MKASSFHYKTLKEAPKDAELVSHKLMIRANMIKPLASGIYSWLPLGLKILNKVEETSNGKIQKISLPFALVDYDQATNLNLPKIHEPCYLSKEKIPPGKYILTITPQEAMSEQKDPFLPFSHLIWF